MTSQRKGLLWLALVVAGSVAVTIGIPYLANLVPFSVEKKAGECIGRIPNLRACGSAARPESSAALSILTKRIFPIYPEDVRVPIEVNVVHDETVNAFAGLGGKIYVHEGLLKEAESPEELAAVLAHEIEHVRRRHILQGVIARLITIEAFDMIFSRGGAMSADTAHRLVNMSFSRKQEAAADAGGLQRLRDARVDVSGYIAFFTRAKERSVLPALLSDHPANGDRAATAAQYRASATEPVLDKRQWNALKSICHD